MLDKSFYKVYYGSYNNLLERVNEIEINDFTNIKNSLLTKANESFDVERDMVKDYKNNELKRNDLTEMEREQIENACSYSFEDELNEQTYIDYIVEDDMRIEDEKYKNDDKHEFYSEARDLWEILNDENIDIENSFYLFSGADEWLKENKINIRQLNLLFDNCFIKYDNNLYFIKFFYNTGKYNDFESYIKSFKNN